MNAPNFEAVTARAGHECRGGLLVVLGNKIPKSDFQKMFYPGAASDESIRSEPGTRALKQLQGESESETEPLSWFLG
jgi:hypothetical protein